MDIVFFSFVKPLSYISGSVTLRSLGRLLAAVFSDMNVLGPLHLGRGAREGGMGWWGLGHMQMFVMSLWCANVSSRTVQIKRMPCLLVAHQLDLRSLTLTGNFRNVTRPVLFFF